MSVGDYLSAKGLDPKKAGQDQWLIRCVFCGDSSKSQKHRHLYVNREHGAYKCHRCDVSGGYDSLRKQLGDEPVPRQNDAKFSKSKIYKAAIEIAEDSLFDHPEVVKYLQQRGLTIDSIVEFRLGYMGAEWKKEMRERFDLRSMRECGVVSKEGNDFWTYNAILIPYFENGEPTQLRGKQIGGRTIGLGGVPTRLFNVDSLGSKSEAFICEGEMDTLLLAQEGYPAVGVPGAGAFKDLWVHLFDGIRRIYIIPDHDNVNPHTGKRAGIEGARRTMEMLGPRAKLLQLPVPEDDSPTDLGDYFIRDKHTVEDFAKLVVKASGKRLFTFSDSISEWNEHLAKEGLKTGFKDLDHYIHPGFLPGQVAIILAKTGVGKTTYATQLIWNMVKSNEPVMMLSLEQMKGEIANRLLRIARYDDSRIPVGDVSERLRNHFLLNDDNRVPPEEVSFLIEEFEELVGHRPKAIIVDYLGYWARSFKGGSQYEQTTAAIMELKRVAKQEKVVVIAPHQVSRHGKRGERLTLDAARDSGAIEETGDFVFGLYAPSQKDGKDTNQMTFKDRADLRLELLKSRHGNVGKEVRQYFAPMSLAVVPAIMNNEPKIKEEWDAFSRSLNYVDFRKEGGHVA